MNWKHWVKKETWQLNQAEWTIIVSSVVSVALITTTAWSSGGASLIMVAGLAATAIIQRTKFRPQPLSYSTWFALAGLLYAITSLSWAADYLWGGRALIIVSSVIVAYLCAKLMIEALDSICPVNVVL